MSVEAQKGGVEAQNGGLEVRISLVIIYVLLLLYIALQGLSHEMDLAFDDMHGQFQA
jgi:hypothetical protein